MGLLINLDSVCEKVRQNDSNMFTGAIAVINTLYSIGQRTRMRGREEGRDLLKGVIRGFQSFARYLQGGQVGPLHHA